MADVDLSEFYKLSKPRRPPCQVGLVAEQLKPAERAQLAAACKADKNVITASAIEQWLKQKGHGLTIGRIVSHRKEQCTCHD